MCVSVFSILPSRAFRRLTRGISSYSAKNAVRKGVFSKTAQFTGPAEANYIGPANRKLYIRVRANVSVYAKARGVWGYAPTRKFLNFGCCEMVSEAILGPKTSLPIFALVWHGKILIHFTSARVEIKCPSAVSSPWERREGATHASRLEFCLVFSLIVFQAMCGYRAQNTLVSRFPQLSLRPDRDFFFFFFFFFFVLGPVLT